MLRQFIQRSGSGGVEASGGIAFVLAGRCWLGGDGPGVNEAGVAFLISDRCGAEKKPVKSGGLSCFYS